MLEKIDFIALLPYALFAACSGAFWVLGDLFVSRRTRAETRLAKIKSQILGAPVQLVKETPIEGLTKILEKAGPQMGASLQPKSAKEMSSLAAKLSAAGFRSEKAVILFSTIKALCLITGLVLGGGITMLTVGMTSKGMISTLGAAVFGMMLPDLVVGMISKSRKQAIFLGLPDVLDMLVVCVEAGLGLDQAMRKVCDELEDSHPIIAHEFKVCNQRLQMGQTRADVLQELGDRNGVDDLKTLASIMIQCDRFGTSVGQALRTQSDMMRTRRRQIAEEKAAKTAVKLLFPLVVFIFPGIFVVLVGPAAIQMVNEMLPALKR
ncbi:MAG: type II secretion system F family protein [Planctomycetota bacterium]